MARIYKYPLVLEICGDCGAGIYNATANLPVNSRIIKVARQGQITTLWVIVDYDFIDNPEPPVYEERNFKIYPTGVDFYIDNEEGKLVYLDSVFIDIFVWHVFEVRMK